MSDLPGIQKTHACSKRKRLIELSRVSRWQLHHMVLWTFTSLLNTKGLESSSMNYCSCCILKACDGGMYNDQSLMRRFTKFRTETASNMVLKQSSTTAAKFCVTIAPPPEA